MAEFEFHIDVEFHTFLFELVLTMGPGISFEHSFNIQTCNLFIEMAMMDAALVAHLPMGYGHNFSILSNIYQLFINVEGAVVFCREDAEIEDFIQIERLQTLGIQAGINAVMIHDNYFFNILDREVQFLIIQ